MARTSNNKKKASSKQNAAKKISARGGRAGAPKVPRSEKQRSQSRFPGETALTSGNSGATGRGSALR